VLLAALWSFIAIARHRLAALGVSVLGLLVAGLFGAQSAWAAGGAAEPAVATTARHAHDAPGATVEGLRLPEVPADFRTFDGGWIRFSYHVSLGHWLEPLMAEAQAFRGEVMGRLGRPVLNRVEVRLAVDSDAMKALAPEGAPYPAYATGVAYSRLGLVLLNAAPTAGGAPDELKETFRHELAHVALHDAIGGTSVPVWFNEGLAIHLSRENTFARTQALWLAVIADKLLPLATIEANFPNDAVGVPLAYAQSADIVRFLLRQEERERFGLLIKRLQRGQLFDAALYDAYGMDVYSLEQSWRADVESRYTVWPLVLGGTATTTLTMALFGLAWRRKRQKEKLAYTRWAREEAVEELQKLRALGAHLRLVQSAPSTPPEAPRKNDQPLAQFPVPRPSEPVVPRVEHDGDWHTLH
jgi:Peptidase MA superfamily